MNDAVGTIEQKQGLGQSAESVIAIALLCVCAAAGLAAWLLSGDEAPAFSADKSVVAKVATVQGNEKLQSEEQAVLAEWQSRLDGEFSQREQNLRQQAQLVTMQQQSEALAMAQASAEAAARAAEVAEARAQNAEKERQAALAKMREKPADVAAAEVKTQPKLASASLPVSSAPAVNTATVPASIDWSSCARPEYPDESVRFGQQGTVTMSFSVDAEGNPSDGKVVDSSGTRRLDYRALSALSRCQFEPERVNGTAVASLAQVRFTWKLTR
ncbi:energy transducer TonB [uncultured Zhongshania sp.]|uniref:energy transducer TonB n=1 Tax=uncultured Zhongshania sp. TaxID=1642288 RepID=UPI0025ED77D2|nr:energy transducer TonB [uncultured Zhongshania sp.]